ncbi:MAG TPA: efflux RND transporter periplasmic adaptor subunit [Thermoanaerobaculia bacterium]|nr:efflux RND transporter periplasmic adaptor subunit [Thermoanaerobaculia bacterium]
MSDSTSKWITRGIVLLVLIVALGFVRELWFTSQPVEVETVAVERGPVESTVTNSKAGTVESRRRAALAPEIGGRVAALPHREGDRVATGDVVLRLDDTQQRAELTRARRDVTSAESAATRSCVEAELAAREYQRNRVLAEDEIIPENLRDQSESAADAAQAACEASGAQVASAQAAVGVLEAALAKTVLRAPFDGIVSQLDVEVGEWSTPSPPGVPLPPALELLDPSSIYLSAPMDEVDSAKIHPGQPVRVTIDPYPDQSFAGRVVRVAPFVLDVEAQNRTVEVEVELEDDAFAAKLLPGTSADVEVILETKPNALRLPTSTLLPGGEVMVLSDTGTIERRQIETGLRNWDFTEVTGGLEEGDRVISSLDRAGVEEGEEAVDEAAGDQVGGGGPAEGDG